MMKALSPNKGKDHSPDQPPSSPAAFSSEHVDELVASLAPMDFSLKRGAASCIASTNCLRPSHPLQAAYVDFYALNFVAQGLCSEHHLGYFDTASDCDNAAYRIAVNLWHRNNARGSVFLLHGYTDHAGLMNKAVAFLLEQNWNVVVLDLPGHGLSSGGRSDIASFNDYRHVLEHCLAQFQQAHSALTQPWHGVGQSTGGAVWLNFLTHNPQDNAIQKVCLLAPLVRPRGWGWLQHVFPAFYKVRKEIPRGYSDNTHDTDFLTFVRTVDPLQHHITPMAWVAAMDSWNRYFRQIKPLEKSLLVIQGDADKTVDFRYNLPCIAKKFPNCQQLTIAGARHHLVNESLPYRQQVFSALENYLSEN